MWTGIRPAKRAWACERLAGAFRKAGLAIGIWCAMGCGDQAGTGLLPQFGFSSIVLVQRPPASGATSLLNPPLSRPGSDLVMLAPATPSGKLKSLLDAGSGHDDDVDGVDVSPDGRAVVAAVRTDSDDRFHLVRIDLDAIEAGERCLEEDGDLGPACSRLTFGPADATRPVHLADGRIGYMRSDPDGQVDFQGRGRSRLLYAMDSDGGRPTRIDFGPGNCLEAQPVPDGSLLAVVWTPGAVLPVRIDPSLATGFRLDGPALQPDRIPVDISPVQAGDENVELDGALTAACISGVGTWQAGTLCQRSADGNWVEILSSIPAGSGCSPEGRLRDPVALGEDSYLVSYAKTPGGCLNASDSDMDRIPDFGLAIVQRHSGERYPLFNRSDTDELQVAPVMERALLAPGVSLPAPPGGTCDHQSVVIEGFIDRAMRDAGAVRIRVLQSLSAQLAPWAMELVGSDPGAICAGDSGDLAPILADGSFRVQVPAGVGLKLLVLDRYGTVLARDPLWRGGTACSRLRCAGCHENDGLADDFDASLAATAAPSLLDGELNAQRSIDFRRDIQPVLNRSCVLSGCHDAESASGSYVSLSGDVLGLELHDSPSGRTTVAYSQLNFVDRRRDDDGRVLSEFRPYVVPNRARDSRMIQKLRVPCRFDCQGHDAWTSFGQDVDSSHPENQSAFGGELTEEERWLLVEWIDTGAAFYGRGATP